MIGADKIDVFDAIAMSVSNYGQIVFASSDLTADDMDYELRNSILPFYNTFRYVIFAFMDYVSDDDYVLVAGVMPRGAFSVLIKVKPQPIDIPDDWDD